MTTNRKGWWVRAIGEEEVNTFLGCNRLWPIHKLRPKGCTVCPNNTSKKQKRPCNRKNARTGIIMRSAPPDELEDQLKGTNHRADVTVTTDTIRRSILYMLENTSKDTAPSEHPKNPSANSKAPWMWFTTASLGHSIREDEYDRPLHPAIAAFVQDNTASHDSLDHMDEAGYK